LLKILHLIPIPLITYAIVAAGCVSLRQQPGFQTCLENGNWAKPADLSKQTRQLE
jgi:hypothetical protein